MKITMGAEPAKVKFLVGTLVVLVGVYFYNSSSATDSAPTPSTSRGAVVAPPVLGTSTGVPADARPSANRTQRVAEREFRPSVRPPRGQARPDPTTMDPTLRLDILAKLQQVNVVGMHRSIFDFGQAPPPPPTAAAVKGPKAPSPFIGPAPPPPPATASTPPTPQAPPVPMKFYGYMTSSTQANKTAFFIEGEDIHIVREGDVVKKRYKIVRIGVNSVVVEDMQFQSQQTLPLEEQPA